MINECLFINTFKFSLSLLAVGFATGNKVSEKDGVVDNLYYTPNQFSKSAFSCASSMTCPSGRSLLSLA